METPNTRDDDIAHKVRGEPMALVLMDDDDDNNNVPTARRLYNYPSG